MKARKDPLEDLIDPFKDLEKCSFEYPSDINGYVRGHNYVKETKIKHKKGYYRYKNKVIPSTIHEIYLGIDREKELNHDLIPDGTQLIAMFNLEDGTGRQVIKYLHSFKKNEDMHNPDSLEIVLKAFCNEFRTKEVRLKTKDFFVTNV